MSEEVKLEYLRERIKQAKSGEKEGIMFIIIGIVFTSTIFAFFGDIFFQFFQILSVFVIIIGVVQMFYFGYTKSKLMEQLRKMGYKEKENVE
ncbi:MAG: hypothetical protein NWE80_00835 [Candidatus Bathyarchaeota archaeon]|nr:hypothetical protein [Candidatus Bathyarchaeota archaeon]